MYAHLRTRLKNDPALIKWVWISAAALGCVLLLECWAFDGYQDIPDYENWHIWATIPVFVAFVPVIFILTMRSKIDNFLGLFSYPVYLTHGMAVFIAQKLLHFPVGKWMTLISVGIFSLILVLGVEIPIDRLRHRLTFGAKSEAPEVANKLLTS
jgi:peptidoglycan/LPS O-acetylase OafA/YrhL